MDSDSNLYSIDGLRHAYFAINVIYIVTMVIGFFGNVLIVSTILKNKYLRSPMNISLVSLALCDIVVCVFALPVRLYLYNSTFSAPYTVILCRADVFLKSVCDYVQPSMLVATSYERYKSIAKPFQSKIKMKRTVILITVTWGTCICCGAVSSVLLKDGATIVPCNEDIITTVDMSVSRLNYREAYITFPLGFSSIIVVSIFYFLMIRTLREHSNKMKKQFKAKPLKNKVHPDKKTDQTVTKELTMNAVTIQPLVLEKSEVNTTDNSRQTSGTSIQTIESIKNNTDNTNFKIDKENNEQSLKVKDIIPNEIDNVDKKSEFEKVEDASANVSIRRISIRKTRDNILLPGNEKGDMRRFSTIAKHVVLLKSHKRRSLKNLQNRIARFSQNNSRTASVVSQENTKREQEKGDDKCESAITHEEENYELNKTVESDPSRSQGVNLHESIQSDQEIEADTALIIKTDNLTTESGNLNLTDNQSFVPSRLTDAEVHSVSKTTKIFVETCDNNLTVDATREQNIKNSDINVKQSPVGNSHISSINITSGEHNEAVQPTDGEMKENKNEISGNAKEIGISQEPDVKTDSQNNSNKISNVDVVDFDGTVHKDVKVEGAVVGAVCVMNKTNRLEGRRKVEMRAAKRIAVLMGSFVLLWLPLPLIALFVSSRRQISTSDIEALITSASISATTIAFNPMLNLLLNKQLRSAALTLLRRVVNTLKRMRL